MDMFLLGLILLKVLVGKPLAPDLPALFQMLRRIRALGSEGDLLIGLSLSLSLSLPTNPPTKTPPPHNTHKKTNSL